MAEIDSLKTGRYEWVGEIGKTAARPKRHEEVPTEVWPGKMTDLASLERNAEAFRSEERRKAMVGFFKGLAKVVFRRA